MTDKYGFIHIGKTGGTAVNAALKANNKLGVGEFVQSYKHKIGLQDVRNDTMCDRVMFFVREPASRFVSAFNSRLRKGAPRHHVEWTPKEELAFTRFKTANDLAEALGSSDAEVKQHAVEAVQGINHLRKSYPHYLGSIELLEAEKDRIYFIGAQENLASDFAVMRSFLDISPDIELPLDDLGAHRTPDGFHKTISDAGRKNIEAHFAADYRIYDWCMKRRVELLALRQAELAQ